MTIDKIWIVAEAANGEVASTTLELLTKARELADTVECVYAGDDADDLAEALGAHGCETVYQTGDLDGELVGVPTAAAIGSPAHSASAGTIRKPPPAPTSPVKSPTANPWASSRA